MPMIASALAYSSFFAIPSTLLLALGLFTLVLGPETIRDLMDRFDAFMPAEATQLLGDSLQRLEAAALGRAPDHGLRLRARALGVDERDDDVHGRAQHRLRPEGRPQLRDEAPRRARPWSRSWACAVALVASS